jgi:hypothetical protein
VAVAYEQERLGVGMLTKLRFDPCCFCVFDEMLSFTESKQVCVVLVTNNAERSAVAKEIELSGSKELLEFGFAPFRVESLAGFVLLSLSFILLG